MSSQDVHLVVASELQVADALRPFDVFPSDGEFRAALGLCSPDRLTGIDWPEVIVHLIAYETVERRRVAAARGTASIVFKLPLWPPALARAFDIDAHAVDEIMQMHAPFASRTWVRDRRLEESSRSILCGLRLDVERYDEAMREAASGADWRIVDGG